MKNIYVFGKHNMTPVKRKKNIPINQLVREAQKYRDTPRSTDNEGAFTERAAFYMVHGDYDLLEKSYRGPLEYAAIREHIMEPRVKIIKWERKYRILNKKNFGKRISYAGYASKTNWDWSDERVKRFVDKIIDLQIERYISYETCKLGNVNKTSESSE